MHNKNRKNKIPKPNTKTWLKALIWNFNELSNKIDSVKA